MKRLTKKINKNIGYDVNSNNIDLEYEYDKIINKLGQLEDIEEEFNINIIRSVELCKKVNNQGFVYTKEKWGIDKVSLPDKLDVELFHHRLYQNSRGMFTNLDVNEYGITWALTMKELL